AIAAATRDTGPHRISHLYMIDKRDWPRFKKLSAVADFQIPTSATDTDNMAYMQSLIGARANQLLPIGSLIQAGADITLSSDWDADELSPLKKLAGVLTRRRQKVPDLATAIEMMTINPARLMRQDDTTGSIEVGKYADIVILDRNLFDMRPERIGTAKVQATLLQGEAVFDAAGR
ncbi:MAG: amidohydrolase family protein, partial [Ectothiorhodospiraceae bacterium]|nr:amidohydrolase family protein [Ectothiorhodospiraceae bacterium]